MKIVSLSTKDSLGGAAKVAYRLHREILRLGVDEKFVVSNKRVDDDTVFRAFTFYGKIKHLKPFWLLDKVLLKYKEKQRIAKWDRYLATRRDVTYLDLEISLLKDALNHLSFDLLQMHWLGENFVNFTEIHKVKTPIVWTLHDCFPFTGICTHFEDCDRFKTHCGDCPQLGSKHYKDFSYKTFQKKLKRYKGLDFHIVCPSNWIAKHAKESRLLGKYPISVIPNGIDVELFSPKNRIEARQELGLSLDKKIVLFGGVRVDGDERKGGKLLEEALQYFEKNIGDEIQLLVFGSDKLSMNISSPIHFLGYVTDENIMCTAYSAADVTVVPSMCENLPTVIMESLSCGTPVAAFNIGGNSDMVDHKKNGYLATPYDTVRLAEGIRFCLTNNIDGKLGENARSKILDNFRVQDVAEKYVNLYKSILDK